LQRNLPSIPPTIKKGFNFLKKKKKKSPLKKKKKKKPEKKKSTRGRGRKEVADMI